MPDAPPAGRHTHHADTRSRDRDLLRTVAEGTAGAVGDEFLRRLVHHVALAFGASFAFVAEAVDGDGGHVRVVSGWYEDDWIDEPFEYDTPGTPCALMVEQAVVTFPTALQARFPEARPAREMGLDSYLSVCLRAADGAHLGHMGVMDAGPMEAGDDDVAAMRIFASRAAAELERLRQAEALRASRERVIEAADAERRRVGRDLHDGAQQRLLAVSTLLTLARRQLGDGHDAAAIVRRAHDELVTANGELRDLARGLHPVALAERGLGPAIESVTATCDIPVTLDVQDGELPESVGLAAYFIVCEALANVTKYAQAESVAIRVVGEDGALLVEVRDDGRGGADAGAGTGLRGLADRIDALGGTFELHSPPGAGTRVVGRLPLPAAG